MKKTSCFLFSALLMVACGDENVSNASNNDLLSSSKESSIESSSEEKNASSSSEEIDHQKSSSSVQEDGSSSDKTESQSQESSSSIQETFSSANETESSSSASIESTSNFGDDKLVLKEIPTFGELDGKPYFYTTQSRCIYKDGVFTLKQQTSDNAYFYTIANDTLTLNHVDLDKVLANTYEEPSARETYYGQNTSLENEWEHLCYYNLNGDYTNCKQSYSYLITKDTIYIVQTDPFDYDYDIFEIIEKILHTELGPYDEMSDTERALKYAENGITVNSSGAKTLIGFKDKGTLSIDELTNKIINNNESIYTKIVLSTDKKECVLTSEWTPVKSSKYCSEEYLPYLQIDDFDGYVSTYAKGNQKEFDACLENLFN